MVVLREIFLAVALFVVHVWPKSLGVLIALDHDILVHWVVESNKLMFLMRRFVNTVDSFDGANLPWLNVSNGKVFVLGSPVFEWSVEDTISSFAKVGLFLEFRSPKLAMSRPWSIILVMTPWISHLDEFSVLRSICVFESETSKTSFSMSFSNVILWAVSSSTNHCPVVVLSTSNNIPQFVVSQMFLEVVNTRGTSQSSQSLTWSSGVKI